MTAEHAATNSGLVLTDGFYDILRAFVEKVFPGLGVLYAALAALWHWSYTFEVGGTFAALSIFGGILLSFARKGYDVTAKPTSYDGEVVSDVSPEGLPIVRVQLNDTATSNLLNSKDIVIKGFDPNV